ncbi:hypothetical protein GSI_00594 [Ganoderma sinense ZZ0214-1]|uniref:Uncharacterized protein n=1 Tax=Ganoderma sinense ZZ0214-1 TaxID=1077348 RepID=A0A2G8ST22_9APHY|nr:hypothetical protein GSI_00594 [Ganoderma sinense ZZ0214-1]
MLQPVDIPRTLEERKLEEQIAYLQQKLRQLRTKSNSQVPIAKLPPEILSEIFLVQAAKIREERLMIELRGDSECPNDLVHKSCYSWLNVSHVSRHWREVSLKCAQLWTWLALEPRITDDIVETLLPRARDLPLTAVLLFFSSRSYCGGCMRLDQLLDHYDTTLRRLEALLPRLRELVLVVDREECEDLWDVLTIPTDSLETIRIEVVGATHLSPPVLVVPSRLFASRTPRLQSLKLSSIALDWPNTLLCSSLRHLDVSRCGMDGDGELQPFLSAICMLPHLETLRANWMRPSATINPDIPPASSLPEEHEIAWLPCLKHVYLSGGNRRIATILMYTRWPVETRMHFTVIDTVAPAERAYFQFAFHILLSKETVRGAMYAFNGFGVDTSLLLWSVAGKITAKDPPDTAVEEPLHLTSNEIPPPRLHIHSDSDSQDHPILLALQTIDLVHLRVLLVLGATTGRQWASMFRPAVHLTTLRVKGQAAFGLPALLAGDARTLTPQDVSLAIRAGLDEWHWLDFNTGGGDGNEAQQTGLIQDAEAQEDLELNAHAAEVLNGAVEAEYESDTIPAAGNGGGGGDEATLSSVLFPDLRAVQIAAVDIALPDGWTGPLPYKYSAVMDLMMYRAKDAKYGLDVAALARCLRIRREWGIEGLAAIEFCGCHCEDMAQLGPLARQGVDVSWDGQPVSGSSDVDR